MTISDTLSNKDFDDRILLVLTTDKLSQLERGDMLATVVDDAFNGEYSVEATPYADVILASIARLQERGLLSMYEDENGNKVSVLSDL